MPNVNASFAIAEGQVFVGGDDAPVFIVAIPIAERGTFLFLNEGEISAVGPSYAAGLWFGPDSQPFGTIDNRGLISASALTGSTALAYGIDITSLGPDRVLNSGVIDVTSGNSAFGLRSYTGELLVHNQIGGVISVTASNEMIGIARGLYLANSGDVINDGLIHVSGGATLYGIQAIGFQHKGNTIINNGSIVVEDSDTPESRSYGIAVTGLALLTPLQEPNIINRGTISADVAILAYYGGWSPFPLPQEWVLNEGEIYGEIWLGAGDDILENRGLIVGDVFLESGNNTYDGRLGSINGDVNTGDGNDTVWSGADDDYIYTGGGNDWISAGAGNDVISAWVGNNTIDGGAGADVSIRPLTSTTSSWSRNPDGSWTVNMDVNGTDTLTSVEYLQFTDRTVFLDRAQSNFSTDGQSDFFLRNQVTGSNVMWFNANSATSAGMGTLSTDWVGQGFGDFNGDGRDDILWRNSTNGNMSLWFMNNQAVTGSGGYGVALNWSISGIGDINGDLRDDIVLRNSNGDLVLWFMNGLAISGAGLGNVAPVWQIEVLGDFNGDGRDDFIWRNSSTGDMSMWLMNGPAAAPDNFANVGGAWSIAGVGDLNGDGRDDVMWRNDSTGDVSLWFMNAGAITSASGFNVGTNYQVADLGDYNGDGRDDIIWRNTMTGDVIAWYMNGAAVTGSAFLGGLGSDWVINPGG